MRPDALDSISKKSPESGAARPRLFVILVVADWTQPCGCLDCHLRADVDDSDVAEGRQPVYASFGPSAQSNVAVSRPAFWEFH